MPKTLIRIGLIAALGVTMLSAPQHAGAQAIPVCYVDGSAAGSQNGSSWTDAYTDLQSALANAACTEIWVAAGVYYPTSGTDQTISFNIYPGVAVYGGFAGNEALRRRRIPAQHVTILSGDIDHNDLNLDGNYIDELIYNITGNNSYHVVVMDGTSAAVSATTVLDGFTITAGDAQGSGTYADGGGMYCNGHGAGSACSPTLSSLTFIGNLATAGGGLFNDGAAGGSASPVITDVQFIGNEAIDAGAIFNDGSAGLSSPILTAVTFDRNRANGIVGSQGYGGGIYNRGVGGVSSPSLTNVTFQHNAGVYGGAIANDGSAAGAANASISEATFSENIGNYGGALWNDGTGGACNPSLSNAILYANTGVYAQPEIYNTAPTPVISHSDIQGSGGSSSWYSYLGTDGGGNLDLNPLLAPLALNGGSTETMALTWGSPAIDAGSGCTLTDQRGVARPQGASGLCDMGAYERIPPDPPAHFAGAFTSNLSVFRPSTGTWYVQGVFNSAWGSSGDVPVPADYGGTGTDDVAVWRLSNGTWYIKGLLNAAWGQSGDVPVPGDYNGDKVADIAVWRPSTGAWRVRGLFNAIWGQAGDIPVPADYNGDGKTDPAVYRPSTGIWYVKGVGNFTWGTSTDIPVPADYNGDGSAEVAVYRPSTGRWYIKGFYSSYAWGNSTDIPVPGDFNGDGTADIAIFRPSTGQWWVKNQFTSAWGTNGDFPLVAPDTNGNGTPYQ